VAYIFQFLGGLKDMGFMADGESGLSSSTLVCH